MTDKQQKYLFAALYKPLAEATNLRTQDIHEVMKDLFLVKRIVNWRGQKIRIRESTQNLTNQEFEKYCQQIVNEGDKFLKFV